MTTRARKFRIRRTTEAAQPKRPAGADAAAQTERPRRPLVLGDEAGGEAQAGRRARRRAEQEQPVSHNVPLGEAGETELTPEQEIEQIRAEGLTGRQLRMARRMAERHGIIASSDYDAVRLLRKKGIDPFNRANLLELVVNDGQAGSGPDKLPAAIRQPKTPSPQVVDEATRAREIMKIQRDLVRRRRRRLAALFVRLALFVALPTLIAGYYYYRIATPMYSVKSEFVIQKAESAAAAASGFGSLFQGTSLANSQDSMTVQSYLQSREAMARLDADHGFRAHFQQPFIDPIQRLAPDATNEAAYRLYKRHVKIGFDPTEGIVKLEVIAASPEAAVEFSQALIRYAEEQVDNLTERVRRDQMKGAMEAYREAEAKMLAAQRRVLELQEQRGVVSADMEVTGLMAQINQFEIELKNKRLELAELLDNPRPNPTKVEVTRNSIARLEELIHEMRQELTKGSNSSKSLAAISGELVVAQADLKTRQMLLAQSLQQLETARLEANRQTRYLSLGVSPVPPDEPTYPRKFENTLLAFLIFAGIYLMASLTASILREQVAA